MAISFGKSGLNKPTPSGTSMIIDIVSAVSGVLIAWVTTANFIPSTTSNIIASIMGLIIGLSQAIKPLFGVKTTSQNIPLDQVSSMDDTPQLPYNSVKDEERNNNK